MSGNVSHLLSTAVIAQAVGIGDPVEILYDGDDESFEVIVDRSHDPARGAISIDSPVGRALLGAREGEYRRVIVGDQVFTVHVVRIR